MKLQINRKTLVNELTHITQVVNKKSTLPILECIKVEVREDGTIVFTGSNLEVSSLRKFKLSQQDIEKGSFCINPYDLLGVLKTLKDEEVNILIEDTLCTIEHNKGQVSFPTQSEEDFPIISDEPNAIKVLMDASLLYEWLKSGVKFAANDELRPIISGVYIYVDGSEMGVAATDAQKLFTDNITIPEENNISVNGTLSINAISPLLDLLNDTEDKVSVYFGTNAFVFRTTNAMINCVKPLGSFPAFKTIIPKDYPIKVSCNKESLIESASRAMLTANANTQILRISINIDKMLIESEDIGFSKKSYEEIPCEGSAEELRIGVKGDNLLSCLNALDTDTLNIEALDSTKAILFLDENNENRRVILMPVRLHN